ncbi:YidH family protein [Pseudomonas sp. IAC-BECa141]|uniref:YidH family protein n=1 Tax=Pseudomonas sp. IAC-BECa141 TaxID=2793103 RepID=UPI001D096796|nr:DUF202 domain-containing protein [Pseudomonas sp. IAC-BECa141]UDI90324.1 DUF202 domain-containing protein [Pseudomonas sp. IAC-BECa141]
MSERSTRCWTERLLGEGEPPDPRFTLANERTFLAWMRTSLALLGGGIAVEALAVNAFAPPLRMGMALSLMLVSLLISSGACLRWLRVERALRQGRALPLPTLVPLLTLACVFAALMLAVVLWPRWHG